MVYLALLWRTPLFSEDFNEHILENTVDPPGHQCWHACRLSFADVYKIANGYATRRQISLVLLGLVVFILAFV